MAAHVYGVVILVAKKGYWTMAEGKSKIIIPQDIFERITSGDKSAFEELYNLTYRPLFAFFLSMTKSNEEAEDLLQETFMKVLGASHLFKGPGNPMAWMMKIGKNIFLMKKRKKQDEYMADYDEYSNDSHLSFDNIKDAENRMLIEDMFKLISEEDRNIIIMHSLMGMKFKEIAEILEKPLGTVITKYNRAMKALNEHEQIYGQEGNKNVSRL